VLEKQHTWNTNLATMTKVWDVEAGMTRTKFDWGFLQPASAGFRPAGPGFSRGTNNPSPSSSAGFLRDG